MAKGRVRRATLRALAIQAPSTENSTGTSGWSQYSKLMVAVHAETEVGTATLDIKIQHSLDNTTWFDLITFTQITAAGDAVKYWSEVEASTAQVLGDYLRVQGIEAGGASSINWSCIVQASN